MPEMSGEETLDAIRERGLPVQVRMVSGVAPDVDLIDAPIDDYLRKPVDRSTLQAKIEALLLRRTFHPDDERFSVCTAKLDALEAAKPADELRQAADATLGRVTEHGTGLHNVEMDD